VDSLSGRAVALGLAASNVVGQIVAGRQRILGRPFGVPSPIRGRAEPWVWGTGLSGPIPLVVAIAVGGLVGRSTRARRLLRLAGATVVVGQLAEPIVWQPHRSPAATRVMVTNLILGLALAIHPADAADSTDRRRKTVCRTGAAPRGVALGRP
jgi:hypothetical protein